MGRAAVLFVSLLAAKAAVLRRNGSDLLLDGQRYRGIGVNIVDLVSKKIRLV